MSGEDVADGGSNAPIDRGALVRILDRVRTNRQVDRAYITLVHDETCLLVEFALDYYPSDVDDAYLNTRWYTNGDFKIHYHETWDSGNWDCRWGRHPNDHNTYDHFHPPPDAPTRGDDASHPDDLHTDTARKPTALAVGGIAYTPWNNRRVARLTPNCI